MSTDGGAHFTTNCLGATNTPDDRMWFAGTGSFADKNLTLYQDSITPGWTTTPGPAARVGPASSPGTPPANAAEHTKYITYPQTHLLSASRAFYDANTGVITLHIPRSDVGTPADGTVLCSATAFSVTSTAPQSATTLFNLTDATTPLELVVGAPGSVGSPPAAPGGGGNPGAGGLTHWSTRGYRYMDFFCLNPIGIRAGYPSSALLRGRSAKERRRVQGRIVLALTASPRYALRGVRPGARLFRGATGLGLDGASGSA